MIDRTKWMPEFIEFFDKFVKTDEWRAMENMKEDSMYHREDSVAVHTCMVLDKASLFNVFKSHNDLEFSRTDENVLAIALLFHDVGKPSSVTVDATTSRKKFFGHEQKSARIFNTFYFAHKEWFDEFRFTRAQLLYIQWLIQNHLPYDEFSFNTVNGYITSVIEMAEAASVHPSLFVCHLYADNRGRISDPDQRESGDEKMKHVIDAIRNFEYKPQDTKNLKNYMYILIGPSGSGKSTYSNRLIKDAEMCGRQIAIYSLDTLRMALYHISKNKMKFSTNLKMCEYIHFEFVADNDTYAKSWKYCSENQKEFDSIADVYLHYLTKENYDIIVDNVNATKSARKKFVSVGKQRNYFITASFFIVSELALKNSASSRTDKKVPIDAVMNQYSKISIPSIADEVNDIELIYREK